MPSDKFKFSAKNGMAPVIKKLYNSHKKLLGRTSTPAKSEIRTKEVKKSKVESRVDVRLIENSEKPQASHTYENVLFPNNDFEEKQESFSEEVFAGVSLSLSTLNLDSENSFSSDTTCVESTNGSSSQSQMFSSNCSTLTNYDETDISVTTNDASVSITNLDLEQPQDKDEIRLIIENKPNMLSEHVTVIEIDGTNEKLKTAIDNFDKIINEYAPPLSKQLRSKPKLQKSKTCSIIESKCILKKTFSETSSPGATFKSLNLSQVTTKSLFNLDRDPNVDLPDLSLKNLMETQKVLSEMDFWKITNCKKNDSEENAERKVPADSNEMIGNDEEPKPVKVKEVIKRLNMNSLSEDDEKKLSTFKKTANKQSVKTGGKGIARKKSDSRDKPVQKVLSRSENGKVQLQKTLSSEKKPILKNAKTEKSISTPKAKDSKNDRQNKEIETSLKLLNSGTIKKAETKLSLIPRAVSCYDVSIFCPKKPLISKIPVKTNLNRTYPSTPGNLNATLDSTMRCTPISLDERDKCQSVQNLAAKIHQSDRKFGFSQKRLNGVDLERTVSCQNLSKSSRHLSEVVKNESLSKIESTRRNISNGNNGGSVSNLSHIGKISDNLSKNASKGRNLSEMKRLSSGNKDVISSNLKISKEEFNTHQVEMPKEDLGRNVSKSKNDLEIGEKKKKLSRNLTYNINSNGIASTNKSKVEIVTSEEKEIVNKFLEDFKDEHKMQHEKEIDKDDSKKIFKVKETAKLKTMDAKTDIRRSDTFGLKKSTFESKFNEVDLSRKKQNSATVNKKNALKRSETYTKNYRVKEFQAIEKIEQSIRTAKEFFVSTNFVSCEIFNNNIYSKANCILNVEDTFELKNMSKPDVRRDGEVLRNTSKINLHDAAYSKDKEYLSDENSDDSGNISNELELEYDEAPRIKRNKAANASISDSFLSKSSDQADKNYNSLRRDKIFFRTGILTQLESQRDEKLAGMVVSLQAHCRGYLARKKLSQRKLQDLAVRCIQRNVRKFLLVRDWPWWRLLIRVTPLLNVHRTEEELKLKTEELEVLKARLEKLETERISLKHHNDKLEAKLTEMTADLAEEHSTSTLAGERLDAETAERIKLERELSDTQQKNKDLQNASERLEMELLYARSELNGISEDDEDCDGEAVYKQRYERAMRELEFTKRRLQQQHEDDLEQLVGLKKQLEKKLTDAYEEVEEQRQVVGQWKRKVQKLNGEMNDLKLLLEEQSSRNNLLEKKQRKFDSELQLLQDELKKEKQAKERLGREKEVVIAEKYTLESQVADLRLEVDLKEEKLTLLQRELDELTYGGKTEEEVAVLRKQKMDCDRRLQDQEEELDELAGQVQLLEQAKLKLEMSLEQQRKSNKKETQQHEEELEEIRCNSQKKMKALEIQLENEHEERTSLLREKHELERRLTAALENDRNEKACDEAVLQRLKRDLKRTKALLRDTQTQLERQKAENPSKTVIRQLKNQIEDLECARSAAVKTKQILESDLSETQALLEETVRQKNELEEKNNSITREKADLQLQVEENEEELAEVLKKYKATIQQMSLDQLALQEQVALVGELEAEKNSLKEQLTELTSKLDSLENMGDASSNVLVRRSELKVKELESKLDLEQTTRSRLEVQISRLKETMEKLQNDLLTSRTKEQNAQDQIRKTQRSLRELRDEHNSALTKESESLLKRKELEKRYEALEAESSTVRTDLRLALKRIEDLQAVIQNDLEDSTENSDSEHESYSSDDSVNTFLAHHKISSKSNSMQFDNQRRLSNTSRSSTSSNLTKDSSYA